jgi:membrane-associated phospholipid phosphatase
VDRYETRYAERVTRSTFFLLLGGASAAAFALVARAVATREAAPVDREVHQQTALEPGHPARRAAEAASPLGKWWMYVPGALLAGVYVVATREEDDELPPRLYGTLAIVGAAIVAAVTNKQFDDLLPQPPAPPGRPSPDHPVFPSGHAYGTLSVALTAAYVLMREEVAHGAIAFPIALAIPVASAAARLVEEKHWISDIAGGYLAALTLASLVLAPYEAARAA